MKDTMWDIAHLAHVELLTPKLDESTRFFTDILGMYISDTQGDSVYLRAYDDYEHHTLKLTAHQHAGVVPAWQPAISVWRWRFAAAPHHRPPTAGRPGCKCPACRACR